MTKKTKKPRRPTPNQIFDAALALNERGSLNHSEAQLDGALACILAGFDDKSMAADVIADSVARAFRMDAEVEETKPVPEIELAAAIRDSIGDALSGSCPCYGGEFVSELPAAPKSN